MKSERKGLPFSLCIFFHSSERQGIRTHILLLLLVCTSVNMCVCVGGDTCGGPRLTLSSSIVLHFSVLFGLSSELTDSNRVIS